MSEVRPGRPEAGDAVVGDLAPRVVPQRSAGTGGPGDRERRHRRLMSLLGAWALEACSPWETAEVEEHLNGCAPCAGEALRLRDAVPLLEPRSNLDLDAELRPWVLEGCLERRPADLPVPSWAAPYDAEAARLDALLYDMAEEEWDTAVRPWLRGEDGGAGQPVTVTGVLERLLADDGLLTSAAGLPAPGAGSGSGSASWPLWREQSRVLVRAAAGADGRQVLEPASQGGAGVTLADAYLERAFACWIHAADIAEAVAYPHDPPLGAHLRLLVDLAARRLPRRIADRRRAGLAVSPPRLTTAGSPGRTLHLEVEGGGGGDWYIPLDSPAAKVTRAQAREAVARLAVDDKVFCRLAAGRISPEEAGAGGEGDEAVIRDVLEAAATLSPV